MAKIEFLRDFNYSNDRLIVGDMAQRDKSYVVLLQAKLNEAIALLNAEVTLRTQRESQWEKRIEVAEKEAAKKIVNASNDKEEPKKEV